MCDRMRARMRKHLTTSFAWSATISRLIKTTTTKKQPSIYWSDSRSFHNFIQHIMCAIGLFFATKIHLTDMPMGTHGRCLRYMSAAQGVLPPYRMTNSSRNHEYRCYSRHACVCVCSQVCTINITFCTDYFIYLLFLVQTQTNTFLPRDVFTVWWPYLFEKDCNNNNSSVFTAALMRFWSLVECVRCAHVMRMHSYRSSESLWWSLVFCYLKRYQIWIHKLHRNRQRYLCAVRVE